MNHMFVDNLKQHVRNGKLLGRSWA